MFICERLWIIKLFLFSESLFIRGSIVSYIIITMNVLFYILGGDKVIIVGVIIVGILVLLFIVFFVVYLLKKGRF